MSTQKKSHATMPFAWMRRNSDQLGPQRRGAGSIARSENRPHRRGRRRCPWSRVPQDAPVTPGRVLASESADDRDHPGLRPRSATLRCVGPASATSSRCQRSSVAADQGPHLPPLREALPKTREHGPVRWLQQLTGDRRRRRPPRGALRSRPPAAALAFQPVDIPSSRQNAW